MAARAWIPLVIAAGDGVSLGTPDPGFSYRHDVVPQQPWSIHVLKVDRHRSDLMMATTLGGGHSLGLQPLSEQVKALAPASGTPIAALNGDFYAMDYHLHVRDGSRSFPGDPRGLHILGGELVSAASDQASFWIDADGNPQATNVTCQMTATWPDGTVTPLGLNEQCRKGRPALYTARIGTLPRAKGGTEFVLEAGGDGPWLPLRPGETYTARVREIRPTGNSPVTPNTLLLALPAQGAGGMPAPKPAIGQPLRISTGSIPDLRGATLAIGGGEVLVRHGRKVPLKPLYSMDYKYRSALERHPRSAIGANRDWWFLVQVDGRQPLLSRGMTLDEMADYLLGLGCDLAMSLDGGPSSTFWMEGEVRNSPCNRRELPVANGIVVLRKGAHPSANQEPQEVVRDGGK